MSSKMAIISLVLILGVTLAFFAYSGGDWFGGDQDPQLRVEEATNLNRFDFSTQQREKLNDQGFVFSAADQKSIYDIYLANKVNGAPSFITTDLVLHTAHLLYNYLLKGVEYRSLQPKLAELTNRMGKLSFEQYRQLKEGKLKKASRVNLAFFSVAKKLIDPSWKAPASVSQIVEEEIRLINRNTEAGVRESPLMGYKVNYATFLPRGDYTQSEKLKSYFKLIAWFGQIHYRLKPGKSQTAVAEGREETLSALLMVKLFQSHDSTRRLWEQTNTQLTELAGPADNLQVAEFTRLATGIFGDNLELKKLRSEEKLDTFIERALDEPPPTALPVWASSRGVPRRLAQGFCFLSKRYDLSTDIFQDLVFPNVGSRDHPRTIPKGLDVMAALGSDLAEELLQEQGEFGYEKYESQLEALKRKISETADRSPSEDDDLKTQWIGTLRELVTDHPAVKKTPLGSTWKLKQLNAALGSWTELKHDTVLYSKVSTAMARGVTPMTKGYVEPRPEIYSSIVEFTDQMEKLPGLPPELKDKLVGFRELVGKLKNISSRELEGRQLTEEQHETVYGAGKKLKNVASPPEYIEVKSGHGKEASRMALVVDVHQDPQSGKMLQEALGNPCNVFALVKIEGKVKLVKGGTYSYYEFTRDSDKLLTDKKWLTVLEKGDAPSKPSWLKPLFAK